jgi:hypothetical protein
VVVLIFTLIFSLSYAEEVPCPTTFSHAKEIDQFVEQGARLAIPMNGIDLNISSNKIKTERGKLWMVQKNGEFKGLLISFSSLKVSHLILDGLISSMAPRSRGQYLFYIPLDHLEGNQKKMNLGVQAITGIMPGIPAEVEASRDFSAKKGGEFTFRFPEKIGKGKAKMASFTFYIKKVGRKFVMFKREKGVLLPVNKINIQNKTKYGLLGGLSSSHTKIASVEVLEPEQRIPPLRRTSGKKRDKAASAQVESDKLTRSIEAEVLHRERGVESVYWNSSNRWQSKVKVHVNDRKVKPTYLEVDDPMSALINEGFLCKRTEYCPKTIKCLTTEFRVNWQNKKVPKYKCYRGTTEGFFRK